MLYVQQKGHFAKSCPNLVDKDIKLFTSLKIRNEEVESLYSEQSSPHEDTIFAVRNSLEEELSKEESLPIFSSEEITSINSSPPHPNIEIQILPTIIDLNTKTIIGIKFFSECTIWEKVIGSKLSGKDILIGIDIFSDADKLQILPTSLKYKREFKPFVETSTLFSLPESSLDIERVKKKLLSLCADNHEGFSHPKPLWKNPYFFVKLPFKLNEDVNPYESNSSWNDII
ncbi:hypothetical protein V8G54_006684 [Vigna mungo]|uniref:Uncharacterized protein n=1 Tax=Vigna mungo TaxID=3915 RepID=A0AAQ3P2C4_VIGMU